MERTVEIILFDVLVKGKSTSDLSGKLDLDLKEFEDFGLEFVYNIEDISDFGSRRSNYSKSFKLPGTPRNNTIFKNVFNLNILEGSFDPNKKQRCIISVNKKILVDGYLKLRSIGQEYIGGKLVNTFSVNIFDEVKDLFTDLGNASLKDLDFSLPFSYMGVDYEYSDHYYLGFNVAASQTREKDFRNVYDYCMINWNTQGDSDGEFYPPKSVQRSTYYLPEDQFFPSVYVKAIVDKIFGNAGYTYNSEFLSGVSYDGLFSKLATIYNEGVMMMPYTNYYKGVNDGTQPGTNFYSGTDPLNNFSYQRLTRDFVYQTDVVDRGQYVSQINITGSGTYRFKLELNKVLDTSTAGDYGSTFIIVNREGDVYYEKPLSELLNDGFSLNDGEPTSLFEVEIELTKNEIVECQIKVGFIDNDPNFTGASFEAKNFSMTVDTIHIGVVDRRSTVVTASEFLPSMTQSDFIKTIIKQFNLYIYPDKLDSKKLNIEPRPDFYEDGQILDWSDKINRTKVKADATGKKLKQTYNFDQATIVSKKNTDYYNENGYTIGDKLVVFDQEELTGTSTIKSDFGGYDVNIDAVTNTDLLTPNFVVSSTDSLATAKREMAPSIGIIQSKETAPKVIKIANLTDVIPNWNTISNIAVLGTNTYDLNFGAYKSLNGATSLDMYDLFWEESVTNLHNVNQRLITMYVNLDVIDFLNMDFRDIVLIDGVAYYLQKVIADFSKKTTSKVELIKAFDTPIDLYKGKESFFYSNVFVGEEESGEGRPTLTNAIFATDRYVKKVEQDATEIKFEPNCNNLEYTWFAVSQEMVNKAAGTWFIDNINNGSIGGDSNLYADATTLTYDGVDYNVYLANYQTYIDNTLTISLIQFIQIGYDFQWGSKGEENLTADGLFYSPRNVSVYKDQIFVVDNGRTFIEAIQVFDLNGNFVSKFGYKWPYFTTGGTVYPWTDGTFNTPQYMCFDPNNDNMHITDGRYEYVSVFDSSYNFLYKYAGDGGSNPSPGLIYKSIDIASTDSKVYILDLKNLVHVFDLNGNYLFRFGSFGTGDGQFSNPAAMDVHNEKIYVGDDDRDDIQIFDLDGNFLSKFGSSGTGDGEFLRIESITVTDTNIYVVDSDTFNVKIFDLQGGYIRSFGEEGTDPGQFSNPIGSDVYENKAYILDFNQCNVQAFDVN